MNSEQSVSIDTVGVIGCGLMGAGIVEVCARNGFSVVVSEVDQEALHAGLGRLRKSLDKGLERGKLSKAEHAEALDRVRGTTDLGDFSACDLVIEAVVENLEAKRQIFARLDEITEDQAILASNTSSISITKLAAATDRPEQVVAHISSTRCPSCRFWRSCAASRPPRPLSRACGPSASA